MFCSVPYSSLFCFFRLLRSLNLYKILNFKAQILSFSFHTKEFTTQHKMLTFVYFFTYIFLFCNTDMEERTEQTHKYYIAGFLSIRAIKFLTFAHPFHIKRDLVSVFPLLLPFVSFLHRCFPLPSFHVCELNIIPYPHNNFIFYSFFLLLLSLLIRV